MNHLYRLPEEEPTTFRSHVSHFVQLARNNVDIEHQEKLARGIGKYDNPAAPLYSARALVDIVSRNGQELGDNTIPILAEAQQSAMKVLETTPKSLSAIEAKLLINRLPIRLSLAEGTVPSASMVQEAFQQDMGSILDLIKFWKKRELVKTKLE